MGKDVGTGESGNPEKLDRRAVGGIRIQPTGNRSQSRHRRTLGDGAPFHGGGSGSRRGSGEGSVEILAENSCSRQSADSVPISAASDGTQGGAGPPDHHGERQKHQGSPGGGAARNRVRRVCGGRPDAHDG